LVSGTGRGFGSAPLQKHKTLGARGRDNLVTMKKGLTILIFIITSTTLLSQPTETEFYQSTDNIKTTSGLEGYKDKYRLNKNYEELLNLGVVQTNWSIVKGRKLLQTRLLTLSVDGQIFYSEFYIPKISENFDSWTYDKIHTNVDSLRLTNLKSLSHADNISINFEHMERHPYRSTFGYACGAAGTMPEEGQMMLQLVKNNDTSSLAKWLESINPMKQVYSYLGLKLLQATDSIQLTDDTIKEMTELENSSTLVYSCSGCTFWEHLPVKEHLTPEKVTRFIERRKKIE